MWVELLKCSAKMITRLIIRLAIPLMVTIAYNLYT